MLRRIIACLIILMILTTGQSQLSVRGQDDSAWEMLELVNDARTSRGIRALYLNSALIIAAQQHSEDMAAGEFLSHTGSDGSEFWQRIADTGYNLTIGAENVLVRRDANAFQAFEQWRGSPEHFANMMHPAYLEMGVAYARAESGDYYFTMVLTSRDDFTLPTVTPVPPTEMTVTPTNTPASPTVIPSPSPSLTPILPSPTDNAPSQTPTDTSAPLREVVDESPETTSTQSEITATPMISPAVLPPSQTPERLAPTIPPDDDLQLIYDAQTFALVNIAEHVLFLEGLTFESTSGLLSIDRWNTEHLTVTLSEFPAGDCLQVWGLGAESVLPLPENCRNRHAWIAVGDDRIFWRNTEYFTVYRFGDPVAVCNVGEGICNFSLADRLTQTTDSEQNASSSIVTRTVAGSAGVRLLYTQDSFTILNTSGGELDLTGIGFASQSGILPVSDWDTEHLTSSLSAFPAGDCLQAWPLELQEWPQKPHTCRYRHAWLGLNNTQTFWIGVDFFTASLDGVVLATCRVASGVCDVELP